MSDTGRARRVILLGPQTAVATLGSARADLLRDGTLGKADIVPTITAGWRERESEDAELDAELGGRSTNLRLYERVYAIFEQNPALARAHRTLQDRLKFLRRAYNLRLAHLIDAWYGIKRLEGDAELLSAERDAALDSIRMLDARHLERVRELRSEFDRRAALRPRKSVRRHRDEILEVLADGPVVAIAGGHIATLLNRLRFLGLRQILAEKTLIAWSAGAMALAPRVVLFHDRPPQGPGNAEAFENGLELYPNLIPFPDAAKRLRLDDPTRTGLLARRFAPSACALLESDTRLEWSGGEWRAAAGGERLTVDGRRGTLNGWRGGDRGPDHR